MLGEQSRERRQASPFPSSPSPCAGEPHEALISRPPGDPEGPWTLRGEFSDSPTPMASAGARSKQSKHLPWDGRSSPPSARISPPSAFQGDKVSGKATKHIHYEVDPASMLEKLDAAAEKIHARLLRRVGRSRPGGGTPGLAGGDRRSSVAMGNKSGGRGPEQGHVGGGVGAGYPGAPAEAPFSRQPSARTLASDAVSSIDGSSEEEDGWGEEAEEGGDTARKPGFDNLSETGAGKRSAEATGARLGGQSPGAGARPDVVANGGTGGTGARTFSSGLARAGVRLGGRPATGRGGSVRRLGGVSGRLERSGGVGRSTGHEQQVAPASAVQELPPSPRGGQGSDKIDPDAGRLEHGAHRGAPTALLVGSHARKWEQSQSQSPQAGGSELDLSGCHSPDGSDHVERLRSTGGVTGLRVASGLFFGREPRHDGSRCSGYSEAEDSSRLSGLAGGNDWVGKGRESGDGGGCESGGGGGREGADVASLCRGESPGVRSTGGSYTGSVGADSEEGGAGSQGDEVLHGRSRGCAEEGEQQADGGVDGHVWDERETTGGEWRDVEVHGDQVDEPRRQQAWDAAASGDDYTTGPSLVTTGESLEPPGDGVGRGQRGQPLPVDLGFLWGGVAGAKAGTEGPGRAACGGHGVGGGTAGGGALPASPGSADGGSPQGAGGSSGAMARLQSVVDGGNGVLGGFGTQGSGRTAGGAAIADPSLVGLASLSSALDVFRLFAQVGAGRQTETALQVVLGLLRRPRAAHSVAAGAGDARRESAEGEGKQELLWASEAAPDAELLGAAAAYEVACSVGSVSLKAAVADALLGTACSADRAGGVKGGGMGCSGGRACGRDQADETGIDRQMQGRESGNRPPYPAPESPGGDRVLFALQGTKGGGSSLTSSASPLVQRLESPFGRRSEGQRTVVVTGSPGDSVDQAFAVFAGKAAAEGSALLLRGGSAVSLPSTAAESPPRMGHADRDNPENNDVGIDSTACPAAADGGLVPAWEGERDPPPSAVCPRAPCLLARVVDLETQRRCRGEVQAARDHMENQLQMYLREHRNREQGGAAEGGQMQEGSGGLPFRGVDEGAAASDTSSSGFKGDRRKDTRSSIGDRSWWAQAERSTGELDAQATGSWGEGGGDETWAGRSGQHDATSRSGDVTDVHQSDEEAMRTLGLTGAQGRDALEELGATCNEGLGASAGQLFAGGGACLPHIGPDIQGGESFGQQRGPKSEGGAPRQRWFLAAKVGPVPLGGSEGGGDGGREGVSGGARGDHWDADADGVGTSSKEGSMRELTAGEGAGRGSLDAGESRGGSSQRRPHDGTGAGWGGGPLASEDGSGYIPFMPVEGGHPLPLVGARRRLEEPDDRRASCLRCHQLRLRLQTVRSAHRTQERAMRREMEAALGCIDELRRALRAARRRRSSGAKARSEPAMGRGQEGGSLTEGGTGESVEEGEAAIGKQLVHEAAGRSHGGVEGLKGDGLLLLEGQPMPGAREREGLGGERCAQRAGGGNTGSVICGESSFNAKDEAIEELRAMCAFLRSEMRAEKRTARRRERVAAAVLAENAAHFALQEQRHADLCRSLAKMLRGWVGVGVAADGMQR